MIPKRIHYCWFGRGEKPKLAKKCIDSWKKLCPDYEVIEWNEENFDVTKYEYTQYCYSQGKWAFLSDFARLIAVYDNGGIYLDTDVELVKRPDELLDYQAFFGFENDETVATGLGFGAVSNHPIVKAMIDTYLGFEKKPDGSFQLIGCPEINTNAVERFGLIKNGERQNVAGAEILPVDYLNPLDDSTGRLNITKNTISINHYGKTWMTKSHKLRSRLTRPLHRVLGTDFFRKH